MSITTMTEKPTIELRKFQHAAFASEETHCFSAQVWVNGKHAFDASNDGHGGCDNYYPPRKGEKCDREAMETGMAILKEYCATLPPAVVGENPEHTIAMDLEILIGEMVNEKLMEKERRRILNSCKKRVVFITQGKDGAEIRQSKAYPIGVHDRVAAAMLKKYPAAIILNGMPEAQAIDALKAAGI